MNVLSPRRRAILTAVWRSNGRPPDYRELARTVGLVSPGDVHRHIDILKRDGYVRGSPLQARTLTLTGKGLLASQGWKLLWTCDQDGMKLA